MTPAEQTTRLQERLARALASGAFQQAEGLLQPYSACAAQALREIAPAERGEFASRVLVFYRWAITLARASRSQACAQLRELASPSPYRTVPAESRRRRQFDG